MGTKFIFVTGGVVSSLGKGITAASLGRLLKSRGYRVVMQKLDPYINVDPGMMSPYQHGEVFVTEDGTEADLDLGHYERFIDENLSSHSTITAGKIYWNVLSKERTDAYGGGTVQVIPHITDEIKRNVISMSDDQPDIVITEIGGTVGDIEGLPFLESIRQFGWEVGDSNVCYIHVTLLPYLNSVGELKTKPTQHSVKELRSIGIQPDVLVLRSEHPISTDLREKVALFCNVHADCVIPNLNADSLYAIPLMLDEYGMAKAVLRKLRLEDREPDLAEWRNMVNRHLHPRTKITIALVGKYTELHDAYLSTVEALTHGGIHNDAEVCIRWIHSESLDEANLQEKLGDVDGILVPSGFGTRGIDGKLCAIRYAREHGIPYLGIGLGMQLAVVEFARDVLGLHQAHSIEVYPETPYPVVNAPVKPRMQDDGKVAMRLGGYALEVVPDTRAAGIYGENRSVIERHRHRYEVNPRFLEQYREAGLIVSGTNPENGFVEMIELKDHPFFMAALFRPELKSRPNRPHPLYFAFIQAAVARHARAGDRVDE